MKPIYQSNPAFPVLRKTQLASTSAVTTRIFDEAELVNDLFSPKLLQGMIPVLKSFDPRMFQATITQFLMHSFISVWLLN